jgi:hypothetical protein
MSQKQSTIICSLKRQHHVLWLLLGLGFSLWLCAQLAPKGATSIALFVGLLVTYDCAGQGAARLIARSILRWGPDRPSGALIFSSLKIGVLFSLLSILFHAVLLGMLASGGGSLEVLSRAQVSILLRAAIFPFLACLGAACTASTTAWSESTEMVECPKSTSLTTTTD